jgi:6-phosphofructokinase 1
MLRLRRDDFDKPDEIARMARVSGLSEEAFRQRFFYLVAGEPRPLSFSGVG